jgi:hypothetical protein
MLTLRVSPSPPHAFPTLTPTRDRSARPTLEPLISDHVRTCFPTRDRSARHHATSRPRAPSCGLSSRVTCDLVSQRRGHAARHRATSRPVSPATLFPNAAATLRSIVRPLVPCHLRPCFSRHDLAARHRTTSRPCAPPRRGLISHHVRPCFSNERPRCAPTCNLSSRVTCDMRSGPTCDLQQAGRVATFEFSPAFQRRVPRRTHESSRVAT